jgi:hypothetical protein
LRALPQVPDQPNSLLEPAPAAPPYQPSEPGPNFEPDPLLDPHEGPQPGWFADVDLSALAAHFKNRIVGDVQVGSSPPSTLHVPGADLDWSFAPRFEVGYRLASGFGAFALSYRYLATQRVEMGPGPDGVATLKSRLDVNVVDMDYLSRELSLWPHWEMQWRFGLRLANLYYDANSEEPLAEALAGSGIVTERNTDRFVGFGTHWALELERHLPQPGLSLVGKIDGWISLGRIRQGFFEEIATPAGGLLAGQNHVSSSQAVPALDTQVGLSYRPPAYPNLDVFVGYQYEYWWNVGRFSLSNSRGELRDQGITLRASFNY